MAKFAARFRGLEEDVHLAFPLFELMGCLSGMELVWCVGQGALFERAEPNPDRLLIGNRRESYPLRAVVLCLQCSQHSFLLLAPRIGIEELVAESPHVAEGAVLDLVEKLSLEDLACLAVGYSARARFDRCSFECWGNA